MNQLPSIRNHQIRPASRSLKWLRMVSVAITALMAIFLPPRGPVMAEDFSSLQWGNQTIHLRQAWTLVPGRGAGVRVCDVDSGVMVNHPDLAGALAGGVNTVDAATPQLYADDTGHGTYTAGIILARGTDIWGVAPSASLLVAKVLSSDGGQSTNVTSGILWCIEKGAQVVNLSVGAGAKQWDGFAQAVAFGCRQGIDFAVAAGNDSLPNEPINPAQVGSPCLITVNASDQRDRLAQFSNFDENPRTVTAPGQVIVSDWTNGGVALGSGTSSSAPFVAGVMALLRSQGADAQTAVRMILTSAHHPRHVSFVHGRNDHLGYGILDAGAACALYHRLRAGTGG